MLLPLLLLLLPLRGEAWGPFVYMQQETFGTQRLTVIWNPLDADTNPTMHVATHTASLVGTDNLGEVIAMRTASSNASWAVQSTPGASGAVGLLVETNTAIVGPRGCDAPDGNPNNGFIVNNCVTNPAQAFAKYQQLLSNFWAPFWGPNSDYCTTQSFWACIAGPLHVVTQNVDSFVLQYSPSVAQLHFAQQVMGVAVGGVFGTERGVYPVNIVRPLLRAETATCFVSAPETFQGVYGPFPYDAYSGMEMDVVLADEQLYNDAGSQIPSLRVLVRRTPQNPDAFWVEFASVLGEGYDAHYFLTSWVQTTPFPILPASAAVGQDGSSPIANAFQTYVIDGGPIAFWGVNADGSINYNQSCNASFAWIYQDGPPQLEPVLPVDSTNWFLEPSPPPWGTAWFNFHVCTLDANGFLAYPYCAFGTLVGGSGYGEWPSLPYSRAWRPPDANFAPYTLSCDGVYPTATFQGYNPLTGNNDGSTFSRENPALDSCFAPLLNPSYVFSSQEPNAAAQDCAKQHMRCWGVGCLVCQRQRATAFCKLGWAAYDFWCYRRFDPSTETGSLTTTDQAAATCANLDATLPAGASQAWVFNGDPWNLEFWRRFVLAPPYDFTNSYQTTYPSAEFVCNSAVETVPGDPSTAKSVVTACIAAELHFPMCRYHQSQHAVAGWFQSMSSQTALLWRDGVPEGTALRGIFTLGRCESGGTGEVCETRTCEANVLTAFSPGGAANATAALNYAAVCAENGGCDQGNPQRCACDQYYGPVTYVPGYPQQYPEFASCPCCCPATTQIGGTYQINDVVATDAVSYLVCGGVDRGYGVSNNVTATCTCFCFPEANTDPFAASPLEPANAGDACPCSVPKKLPNDYVQNPPATELEACNNRGTCCPIRTTESDGTGIIAGGSSPVCYPNGAVNPTSGCVCDDGWAGPACTAVAPSNLARDLPAQTAFPYMVFVVLPEYTVVGGVVVAQRDANIFVGFSATTTCTPTQVLVSPFAPVSANLDELPGTPCVYTQEETQLFWKCPPLTDTLAVVVVTQEAAPRCTVSAMTEYFPPCGVANTTNPFVSGAWRYSAYRQVGLYQRQSLTSFAPYGSAYTDCMCDPNHAGPGCGATVSSVTLAPDGASFTQMTCGADTIPPRGAQVFDGSSVFSACAGYPFAGTQAVGAEIGSFDGATDEQFVGPGNAWQVIFNPDLGAAALCNGHGTPVPPSYPYGFCDFAEQAYENDPLYTPFVVAPGQVVNYQIHAFGLRPADPRATGDSRSVVSIASEGLEGSWLLPSGQYVNISSAVQNSLGYWCAQTTRVPLQVTFATAPVALSPPFPVRATATVTVWTLDPDDFSTVVTVETCDPALYNATAFAAPCSTQNWCPAEFLLYGGVDAAAAVSPTFVTEPAEHTCIAYAAWSAIAGTDTDLTAFPNLLLEPECSSSTFLQSESNAALLSAVRFAPLDCANFIHRQVDVSLWANFAVTLGYVPQCFNEAIQPYMYTLGAFYGAAWNQIPDLPFPADWTFFTGEHYKFLASLYNGLRTFDAAGNPLDDVVTEQSFDQYLLQLPLALNYTASVGQVVPPVVVDGSLYAATAPPAVQEWAASGPPRSTWINFHSMQVPWVAWDSIADRPANYRRVYDGWAVPAWLAGAFVDVVWGVWALQTGYVPDAYGGVTKATFGGLAFAAVAQHATLSTPGVWQSVPGVVAAPNVVFTVVFPANVSLFQAVRNDGAVCATLFHVVAGTNASFSCSAPLPAANVTTLAQYMSALFAALGGPAGDTLAAPYNAVMNATGTQYSWTAMDDWNGLHFRSVPYDSQFVSSGQGTALEWNYAYATFGTQFLGLAAAQAWYAPYRIPSGSVFSQEFEQTSSEFLNELTQQIVVDHTLPFNHIVAQAQAQAVANGGSTRAFDWAGSYSDRIALKNSWYTLWVPFQCTPNEGCQAFSQLGMTQCVYPSTLAVPQGWANGDPDWVGPLSVGNQGGCRGFAQWGRGFWDSSVFNMAPVSGYGPASVSAWTEAVQWQRSVQAAFPDTYPGPFFDETAFPFATLLTLQGDALVAYMNQTLYASLPWDSSTAAGVCSGGGTATVRLSELNSTLTVWKQPDPTLSWTPTCTTLLLGEQEFDLAVANNPQQLVYWARNSTDSLTVLYGAPILSSTALNLTATATLTGCATSATNGIEPVGCQAAFPFAAAPLALTCLNPALFQMGYSVTLTGFAASAINFFLAQIQSTPTTGS